MSEQETCVCGKSKSYHENWPRDCGPCPCVYRPVLDWPDSEGNWWCDKFTVPAKVSYVRGVLLVGGWQSWYDRREFESLIGPAAFVKLAEACPFTRKETQC